MSDQHSHKFQKFDRFSPALPLKPIPIKFQINKEEERREEKRKQKNSFNDRVEKFRIIYFT